MQSQYKCPNCSNIFEAEGEKFEYHSPIYGPCSKNVSESPCCKVQSDEYREPHPGKKSSEPVPMPAGGCCCGGGGCEF
jgi:hypothetical protein